MHSSAQQSGLQMNYLKCDPLCLRAEVFTVCVVCVRRGLHEPIHYWITKKGRAQVSPHFPSEESQCDATSCAFAATTALQHKGLFI